MAEIFVGALVAYVSIIIVAQAVALLKKTSGQQ